MSAPHPDARSKPPEPLDPQEVASEHGERLPSLLEAGRIVVEYGRQRRAARRRRLGQAPACAPGLAA